MTTDDPLKHLQEVMAAANSMGRQIAALQRMRRQLQISNTWADHHFTAQTAVSLMVTATEYVERMAKLAKWVEWCQAVPPDSVSQSTTSFGRPFKPSSDRPAPPKNRRTTTYAQGDWP